MQIINNHLLSDLLTIMTKRIYLNPIGYLNPILFWNYSFQIFESKYILIEFYNNTAPFCLRHEHSEEVFGTIFLLEVLGEIFESDFVGTHL